MLRDAVDPALGPTKLIRRFYTRWFAIDISVRDLFPPDMGAQRAAFAKAMTCCSPSDRPAGQGASGVPSLSLGATTANTVSRTAYDSMQEPC